MIRSVTISIYSITYSIIGSSVGLSTISSVSLSYDLVADKNLVPSPADGIITLLTFSSYLIIFFVY